MTEKKTYTELVADLNTQIYQSMSLDTFKTYTTVLDPTYSPSYSTNITTSGSPTWTVNIPNSGGNYYNYTVNTTGPDYYQNINISPKLAITDPKLEVTLDDGSIVTLSRDDLIKYISEQQLVRENELVRAMYERYQVAVKLVRSDDDGDERS